MRRAALIYAAVNRIAYPIWLGLLAIRMAIVVAALCLLAADWAISHASAAPAVASQRDAILYQQSKPRIAQWRSSCATGWAADATRLLSDTGFSTLSAGSWCVTVLTRAGRDGTLRYMSLADGKTTSALAFDTGFVGGFLKREAVPKEAPTMQALLPVADRCLDKKEPDTALCGAVGYMLGARAALGELVPAA